MTNTVTAETETKGAPPAGDFGISASAAARVAHLLAQDENAGKRLRVSVSGGGCAGFQYGFDFDAELNDDDKLYERDGAEVVVDEMSLELLKGSELDYVQNLVGSFFAVNNPNATSSCGCGTSFSI